VALAAVLGVALDEIRTAMGGFEEKKRTGQRMMWEALDRLGAKWRRIRKPSGWPEYGLARVAFEGYWTGRKAAWPERERNTHWVGVDARDRENTLIFDVNAVGAGNGGWCGLGFWEREVLPVIIEGCGPKANGRWSVINAIEIETGAANGGAKSYQQ
jgi:hypothetical protein